MSGSWWKIFLQISTLKISKYYLTNLKSAEIKTIIRRAKRKLLFCHVWLKMNYLIIAWWNFYRYKRKIQELLEDDDDRAAKMARYESNVMSGIVPNPHWAKKWGWYFSKNFLKPIKVDTTIYYRKSEHKKISVTYFSLLARPNARLISPSTSMPLDLQMLKIFTQIKEAAAM